MHVLGIDIASQDSGTASCMLACAGDEVSVVTLEPVNTNAQLRAAAELSDWTGIDAPLGWPRPFVDAVQGWTREHTWPDSSDVHAEPWRNSMTLRATDVEVHRLMGRRPLSVSSDKIAYAAMRAVHLLAGLGASPGDRGRWLVPDGPTVVEVYPGGTLRALGFESTGYKRADNTMQRAALARAIGKRWPQVQLPAKLERSELVATEHVFDAWLAAISAWRVSLGATVEPADDLDLDLVRTEGWIHLPVEVLTLRARG